MEKLTITTPEQVAANFGADFDPTATTEQNNARLSHRVYKDTSCGAWANVTRRDTAHREAQEWTARYAKVEGVWQLLALFQEGIAAEFSVHDGQIREYFFPTGIDMGGFLDEQAAGASTYTATETIEVKVKTGEEWIFSCGSIVEGIDAEVMPKEVALPCTLKDLTDVVEAVEVEAQYLWELTHGCEDCSDETEIGYRRVNPDCLSCGGDGTSI
jgi:hypothetical protein